MEADLLQKITQAIEQAVSNFENEQQNPHFLVLGSTGAGKSSLINRIFREDIHAVGHIASTTHEFSTREFGVGKTTVLITDSPGYGEVGHDESYSKQVVEAAKQCHVIILVLKADEKGYQRDIDILTRVFKTAEFGSHRPLLIALNQIDKLPPIRDWAPSSYRLSEPVAADDADKAKNIKNKLNLVREQFKGLLAASDSNVLPVMSASNEGEVFGISAFREKLFEMLPEAAKLKYARATKIAQGASAELLEKLDAMADGIIKKYAGLAARAVALNFVPSSDWFTVVPIQIKMIVELGAVYGKPVDAKSLKEILGTLGAGLAARTFFQWIISLLPGVKNVVGPIYAGAATYGMGFAAKKYFQTGRLPSPEAIKEVINDAVNHGSGSNEHPSTDDGTRDMGTQNEEAEKPKGWFGKFIDRVNPVKKAQRMATDATDRVVTDIETRAEALLGKKIVEAEAASKRLIDHAAEQVRILKSELLADAEARFDIAASKKLSEADAMLTKHRSAFEQQTDRLFRRAVIAAGVLLVAAAVLAALLILLNAGLGH